MAFHSETTTPAKMFADMSMMSKFILDKHADNIDPLMLPVCKWFNERPGLTTLFSCEGHPEETEYDSKPYIMFAFEEDGLNTLIRFMNHLNQLVMGADEDGTFFSEIEVSNAINDESWYMCLVLRGPHLPTTEIKARWYMFLNEAVRTFTV